MSTRSAARRDDPGRGFRIRAGLLSNGRFGSLLTDRGDGYSVFEGFALTRWAPDPALPGTGHVLHLSDLDSGRHRVLLPAGPDVEVRADTASLRFETETGGVAASVRIAVSPDANVEVRRIVLANRDPAPRRLELATYLELVLNTLAADAAHPAFSRLFVQTEYDPETAVLLAWRRLRSPDEIPLWAGYRLLAPGPARQPQFETDRARFVGRGRTPLRPRALEEPGPLTGTVGNVLDPIFAMRADCILEPDATAEFAAILAAAHSREEVCAALHGFDSLARVADVFAGARPAPVDALDSLGLPGSWCHGVVIGPLPSRTAPQGGRPAGRSPAHGTPGTLVAAAARDRAAGTPASAPRADASDVLRFWNGTGGFTAAGDEYVIPLAVGDRELRWPPQPWTNVVSNEQFGFIVSESGAGCVWAANSRENRITPWSNDPVSDPHGDVLYVRDEDDGTVWSPLPGPVTPAQECEVRHGFGYSRFRKTAHGLEQDCCFFVPREDPLRILRVSFRNPAGRARRVTLISFAQLVLGALAAETRGHVVTAADPEAHVLFARNPSRGVFAERVAFATGVAASPCNRSWTTDRKAFLGPGGIADPAGLHDGTLDGAAGERLDPCFAIALTIEVPAHGTAGCAFLLGEAESEAAAHDCLARYRTLAAVDGALREVRAFWDEFRSGVQIETPAGELDVLMNGWLACQNLSCRIWGRSAFYQSGGAFGYRDQLQDAAALLYLDPRRTREQLLLHAAHQFIEGDVLHWWHPPGSRGIRTRFADDLLWLPYITAFYVRSTGDTAVLDEPVRFLEARHLEPDEDEAFVSARDSGRSASLLEHCCRALDRSLATGAHGLPLMGSGDWNDGMNRVGRLGRGESVWLGFFLFDILGDFGPLCAARGARERSEIYGTHRAALWAALNDGGWDGAWYRRAYYDDGTPLGTALGDECRIDAIAQAWAVMSGAAPPERAELALDALESYLVSENEGIIRLLTPAFDRTPHHPGYIKGYVPGVRENGGQYTHGALWAIRALAEAGRRDRVARLLALLSPVSRARSPDDVARYRVEPYVVAADVYSVPPHVGRGGWTWYTGSAGWFFRVVLESLLGFQLREGKEIALRPCVPDAWPGFRIRYRHGARTVYAIVVERGSRPDSETRAWIDGVGLSLTDGIVRIPLVEDHTSHEVRVTLGRDAVSRYQPRPPIAERA